MIEVLLEGFNIRVGTNKEENDCLVRESDPEDYWVHISNYPSAHAIIKSHAKGKFPLKQIKQACIIVKNGSTKCKSIHKLQFDITKIKFIETTSHTGMVNITKLLRNINI